MSSGLLGLSSSKSGSFIPQGGQLKLDVGLVQVRTISVRNKRKPVSSNDRAKMDWPFDRRWSPTKSTIPSTTRTKSSLEGHCAKAEATLQFVIWAVPGTTKHQWTLLKARVTGLRNNRPSEPCSKSWSFHSKPWSHPHSPF